MVRRGSTAFTKDLHVGAFVFTSTCRFSRVRWVWSRLWSFRVQNGVALAGPQVTMPLLATIAQSDDVSPSEQQNAAEKLSRFELRIEEPIHELVEIGIPPRG